MSRKPQTPPAQDSAKEREARHVAESPISLQVGFYNIGWTDTELSGQNHKMHRQQLGRDCARAFEFNDLGMLCLCEVGSNKLDENLHAHLGNNAGFQDKYRGQDVNIWLEQVIQECCKTSIDLQAYVMGPYAIVLDKSVCCLEASRRIRSVSGAALHNCQRIEGIIASMYRKPKEMQAGEASQQLYFTKAAAA